MSDPSRAQCGRAAASREGLPAPSGGSFVTGEGGGARPRGEGGRRRVPAGAPLLARQRGAHPFTAERPLTLEWPTGHSTSLSTLDLSGTPRYLRPWITKAWAREPLRILAVLGPPSAWARGVHTPQNPEVLHGVTSGTYLQGGRVERKILSRAGCAHRAAPKRTSKVGRPPNNLVPDL